MIKGHFVELRAICIDDVDKLHKWANDSELWSMLGGWHFPYNKDSTAKWVQTINCNDKFNQHFAISISEGKIIGTINLSNIDWKNRSGTYGVMIGDRESRGEGYATEAVRLFLKYAFEELGLVRIESDILASNVASLKFHEKLGWVVEGEKRMADYRKGKWQSKYLISFTVNDYKTFFSIDS